MAMQCSQRAAWALPLAMNRCLPCDLRAERSDECNEERSRSVELVLMLNHNAALSDGVGGALWLPFYYLRRDATALGLLLLSMLDITSSFH